ncbi:MAG: trypsin-like peptidase domain-containing protein [Planctomycetes bacterium]|nr:trypsin-like peptidase domain-containing protein [Planctomycetota bacterium]
MRLLLALALFALAPHALAVEPVRIVGETKYKPHSLVRLRAENVDPKAAILWRVHPAKGVQRATTPRGVLEFAAHPGTYEIELLVIRQTDAGLVVEESQITVAVEGCGQVPPAPVPPDPKPPGKANVEQAIGKLRFGSAGCTATVIGPRRPDGKWDVLTAAHCTGGVGSRGTFTLKDGRVLNVTVAARNADCDVTWLVTDSAVEDLPFANLAVKNPPVGTEVWHMGYGVDQPGNREDGRITGAETSDGQLQMELSVSSGDSGGGIFRADTNELVAVVCCTTERGRKVLMFGGSAERAARMRPVVKTDTDAWEPLAIPVCVVRKTDADWQPIDIPVRRK